MAAAVLAQNPRHHPGGQAQAGVCRRHRFQRHFAQCGRDRAPWRHDRRHRDRAPCRDRVVEHAAEFEFADPGFEVGHVGLDGLHGVLVLFHGGELEEVLAVGEALFDLLQIHDNAFAVFFLAQLTPWRSLKVHSVLSAFTPQASAREG